MAAAPLRPAIVTVAFLLGLLALSSNPVLGNIECEELPVEDCAFAVSSSGARCVLEKDVQNDAAPEYKCQTSIIMAERPMEWIETEDCINTCGLQRLSVGLSTDALLEHEFTRKLCFSQCRSKCPNINDLYTKLAAGEGIYLPSLCDSLRHKLVARRLISSPQTKQVAVTKPKREGEVASSQNMQLQSEVAVAAAPDSAAIGLPSYYKDGAERPAPPFGDHIAEEPSPAKQPPSYYEDGAEPPYSSGFPLPSYTEGPSPLSPSYFTTTEPPINAEPPSAFSPLRQPSYAGEPVSSAPFSSPTTSPSLSPSY